MMRIARRFGLLFPVATGAILFASTGIAFSQQTQGHGTIDFGGERIWIVVLIIALRVRPATLTGIAELS